LNAHGFFCNIIYIIYYNIAIEVCAYIYAKWIFSNRSLLLYNNIFILENASAYHDREKDYWNLHLFSVLKRENQIETSKF